MVFAACTSANGGDDVGGGGGGGGGGEGGGSVDAADTVSAVVMVSDEGDSAGRIVIASTSQLCRDVRATPPIDRKGQRFMTIDLHDVGGAATSAPTAPGTYTVYSNTGSRPAKSASIVIGAFDDSCQVDETASGQRGTVTLTMATTQGTFAGSYDVVLNTDERVTGTFNPSACPELQATVDGSVEHACQ
jgi:hypothetical protein